MSSNRLKDWLGAALGATLAFVLSCGAMAAEMEEPAQAVPPVPLHTVPDVTVYHFEPWPYTGIGVSCHAFLNVAHSLKGYWAHALITHEMVNLLTR